MPNASPRRECGFAIFANVLWETIKADRKRSQYELPTQFSQRQSMTKCGTPQTAGAPHPAQPPQNSLVGFLNGSTVMPPRH